MYHVLIRHMRFDSIFAFRFIGQYICWRHWNQISYEVFPLCTITVIMKSNLNLRLTGKTAKWLTIRFFFSKTIVWYRPNIVEAYSNWTAIYLCKVYWLATYDHTHSPKRLITTLSTHNTCIPTSFSLLCRRSRMRSFVRLSRESGKFCIEFSLRPKTSRFVKYPISSGRKTSLLPYK